MKGTWVMTTMRHKGLVVDTKAIAAGIYEMIEEKGEAGVVSFGMIPVWVHDMLTRLMREKVLALKAEELQVEVPDLMPYVNEELVEEIVKPIVKQIATDIYGAAKAQGKMCV